MNLQADIFSVSQVNQYLKRMLDSDRVLSGIFVRGELSNYKTYPSGHHYFTLKDAESAIRCVMFRREAASLRFRPENGMKVVAFGRITVFPRDGQYQLYCSQINPDGAGDLHVAFEQLKAKLHQEGLFDLSHKRPIPPFPAKIALITSPAGAAVRDMIRILGARWPMAQVLVLPVRVQGAQAPGEICAAISWANQHQAADLIITGRGGGSAEDLWAFNDEDVARTIYRSAIPVISAVGHEPDVTIADFTADLRAATPSNAAELAVPNQTELYERIGQLERRLGRAMSQHLDDMRIVLERAQRCRVLCSPMQYIDEKRQMLDYQRGRLAHGLSSALRTERGQLERLAAALDALSPLKVLGRGYAIAYKENGTVVRTAGQTAVGERLQLRLADGSVRCEVLQGPAKAEHARKGR